MFINDAISILKGMVSSSTMFGVW